MSSGPLTLMKLQEHWVATALASRVLPLPGGPYSSTPERRRSPPANSSLRRAGRGGAGGDGQ
jgi:hypothetical protein